MDPFRFLFRTWFTGLLYFAAAVGYIFYGVLIILRYVQNNKIFITVCIVIIAAALAIGALFVPFRRQGPEVELKIEKGQPVREVALALKKKKVVSSAAALILWVKLRGIEKKVQAGKHVFREHEGVVSAARKLQTAESEYVKLTIPEGLIIEQIASLCARELDIDSSIFDSLCYDSSFSARYGRSDGSLEGYLFPNTYRFHPQPNASEVIERLVRQFNQEYERIKETRIKKNFTKLELVTLASIIEKEAALASERSHISGVFHNRLKKGIPLGADPTVRYVLRKFSGPLRVSELNISSPYNTRIRQGLPPAPICSPGRGALQAAANPLQTDDLYFVAKWDGSGAHDFSTTHVEHDRKKHLIRRKNKLRKKGIRREKK